MAPPHGARMKITVERLTARFYTVKLNGRIVGVDTNKAELKKTAQLIAEALTPAAIDELVKAAEQRAALIKTAPKA
jgi:hypothetical protein